MTTPLLILGAGGQLGTDLMSAAARAGVEAVGLAHGDLDITDGPAVSAALHRFRPTAVVNSCSFTNVEQCEEDPARAHEVNAVGAGLVAGAAARIGALVVYVSTDYVFDGGKPPATDGVATPSTSYSEDDPIAPLNVYGVSKAAGEKATAAATSDHLIVRVSSLFGAAGSRGKGGNFIETIARKAREGAPLRVVNDQWMSPTYTADAAEVVVALTVRGSTGILHAANRGVCTWYELASEVVRLVDAQTHVEPVSASEYASKARRPRNSSLDTRRATRLLAREFRSWRDGLRAYVAARRGQ